MVQILNKKKKKEKKVFKYGSNFKPPSPGCFHVGCGCLVCKNTVSLSLYIIIFYFILFLISPFTHLFYYGSLNNAFLPNMLHDLHLFPCVDRRVGKDLFPKQV